MIRSISRYPGSKSSYFDHPEEVLALQSYEVFVILNVFLRLKNLNYRIVLRNHPKSNITTWRKLIKDFNLPVEIDNGIPEFFFLA